MRDIKYLIAYTAPILAFWGLWKGGVWTGSAVYLGFIVIPTLEMLLPASTDNFSEQDESKRLSQQFFDWLLYLHIPILYALLFYFFSLVAGGTYSVGELIGMTASVGFIIGAFGINVAHELGHRPNWVEQRMASALLLPALYMHFTIEHNHGHHKNVGTDADPSSAKKGEAVYAFWWRSVSGVYRNAWQIQMRQLQREQQSFWSWKNQMLWFTVAEVSYLALIGLYFGGLALGLGIAAAVFGFLLLETVNYIEHYGLRRRRLPSGRYEQVRPRHSWNSNHELGRIFLYELTRHSDHHFKATRKYQVLRHFEESPQLPAGYPASMLLSLVPPLWFKVADQQIERYQLEA